MAVPVYVEDARNRFGRMVMSHMLADSLRELFEMADRIGVARKWYQGPGKASCPHFDISASKRELAIQEGALVVDRRGLVDVMRRIKEEALARVRSGLPPGWDA